MRKWGFCPFVDGRLFGGDFKDRGDFSIVFFRVCCLKSIAQFLKIKIKTCFYVLVHFWYPGDTFQDQIYYLQEIEVLFNDLGGVFDQALFSDHDF